MLTVIVQRAAAEGPGARVFRIEAQMMLSTAIPRRVDSESANDLAAGGLSMSATKQ